MGAETTVNIDIAGEKFVGHGLSVRERNYLEVYIYERWSDKEIVDYSQTREFQPTSIDMLDSSTEPPRLLTEADLIVLMDKHGIGTDATHAEHIETVKSREYVFTEDRDKLVPGKLAMALVEGYDGMGFSMSKPNLRAALENDLVDICEGRKTKDEVLQEQIERYKQVFQAAMDQVNKLDRATQHFLEEDPANNDDGGGGGGDGGGGGGMGGAMLGLANVEPVVECVQCNSKLALKTKQSGGWMVSCQGEKKRRASFHLIFNLFSLEGYPACRAAPIWLPSSVKEASVSNELCQICPNNPKQINIRVSGRAMAPFYPDQHTGCLGGCDPDLLEVLGIEKLNSGAQAAAQAPPPARGGARVRGAAQARGGAMPRQSNTGRGGRGGGGGSRGGRGGESSRGGGRGRGGAG